MSDLFSTRKMLEMVEDRRKADTFLRDTFFGNVKTFGTKFVEYDFKPANRQLVDHIGGTIGGSAVQRKGFKNYSFEAPEVGPELITIAEDLMNRSAGEDPYNSMSPQERAAKQLGEDLAELDDQISRKEEYMCAQALLCGGLVISGDGIEDRVNFWTTPDLDGNSPDAGDPYEALTSSATWDNASTANPIGDLVAWSRNIRKGSGINPSKVVMGSEALDAFLKCNAVKNYLDNRRIDFGNLEYSDPLPNGAQYYGRIAGLDVFSYDSYVELADGTEVPIFDTKKILIGSERVPTFMGYGACAVANDKNETLEIIAAPRVPNSRLIHNPVGRIVQIKSRPLPVIQHKAGFFVGKVLASA